MGVADQKKGIKERRNVERKIRRRKRRGKKRVILHLDLYTGISLVKEEKGEIES